MNGSSSKRERCAIYTRKSTDEGLDQSFNSLDAQRESCEAYVRSQAGEGWRVLPEHYDDGGYSGGNLDRPAMRRLLADIDAGKVDVIVVYKVDRLTRSLLDFCKIVERLDARGVSFVSVTQAFNTTTSMGRLTLNVLLSFAQFEREVTGERIRDKIAASKAKGMWMGGNVPLGYDLSARRLIANPLEAERVRHIFNRYLKVRSGVVLMEELRCQSIFSKRWIARSGKERGGSAFSCGALYYLLQNRLYIGEIVHRGVCHQGDHEAIVDRDLFEAVQQALAENRKSRRTRPTRATKCSLAGLVRGADGEMLTTTFSYGREGRLYRYYVVGSLDPSRRKSSQPARRVPAAPLERLVLQVITRLLQRQVIWQDVRVFLSSVELNERSIQLVLESAAFLEPHEPLERAVARLQDQAAPDRLIEDCGTMRLIVDRKPVFRGGKAKFTGESARCEGDGLSLLRSAHKLLVAHSMSPLTSQSHSRASAPTWQRQRRTMVLGLLAPQTQKRIANGTLAGSLDSLLRHSFPLAWVDQSGEIR